jgi:hypothetical protein
MREFQTLFDHSLLVVVKTLHEELVGGVGILVERVLRCEDFTVLVLRAQYSRSHFDSVDNEVGVVWQSLSFLSLHLEEVLFFFRLGK